MVAAARRGCSAPAPGDPRGCTTDGFCRPDAAGRQSLLNNFQKQYGEFFGEDEKSGVQYKHIANKGSASRLSGAGRPTPPWRSSNTGPFTRARQNKIDSYRDVGESNSRAYAKDLAS